MIDAKELRLGNWLINEYGREYQVDGHEIYQFDAMPEYRELWHPIPLTPEVLEACGLDKVGSIHGEPEVSVKGLWIGESVCIAFNKRTTYITSICGKISFSKIKIEHLHTLQNAVALCGQELEYKPKV